MKHVTVREIDGIVVIRPKGTMSGLWGGEETDAFVDVLRELGAEGARRVIVDLGAVNHMSSPAVGALFHTHKRFADRGARIVLCHLSERLYAEGAIVKLSVCEICGTLREALVALGAKSHAA